MQESSERKDMVMTDRVSQDILVPTDFGPGSHLALERAIRSLGPEGGNICVLHVIDQHLITRMQACIPEIDETELRARLRQEAEAHYAQLVASLERDQATVEPMIIEGTPFLKIVQLARDLDGDMIVMTVHRGAIHVEQVLFGSTAERVLRLAPCAVLIVPQAVAPQSTEPVEEHAGHTG
jgi:nucleotide-binding universal stress UspA family protein